MTKIKTVTDTETVTDSDTDTKTKTKTKPKMPVKACLEPSPKTTVSMASIDDEQLALMAKALGHPIRVKILRLLAERKTCVTGDLVSELPLAQSTVSEHLRIMRDAGLIQGEIEGPRTSYCVNTVGLSALQSAINSL